MSVKKVEGKNGNVYYRMNLESQDGDAGTLNTTEDIYKMYENGTLERFSEYRFYGVYNAQYGSLSIQAFDAIE